MGRDLIFYEKFIEKYEGSLSDSFWEGYIKQLIHISVMMSKNI